MNSQIKTCHVIFIILLVLNAFSCSYLSKIQLVKNKQTKYHIVLSENANSVEKKAALKLKNIFRKFQERKC